MAPNGIFISSSPYSVKETIDKLQELLQQKGVTIYARINQQREANNVGQNLLPIEFILFGNPKAGGPIMAANPLVALDLPLKAIVWLDANEKVWIAYNDAEYIEERYSLAHNPNSPLNITGLIAAVVKK